MKFSYYIIRYPASFNMDEHKMYYKVDKRDGTLYFKSQGIWRESAYANIQMATEGTGGICYKYFTYELREKLNADD